MRKELIDLVQKDCELSLGDAVKMLNSLRDQTLLITGGTGFMGKWLAESVSYLNHRHSMNITLYLLARNIQRFEEEVPHLAKQPFIHLIEQDIRNVRDLPPAINMVIHAAASPDNRDHATEPLRIIDTIYKGTSALFEACMRLPNLVRFLYISSNYVYGQLKGDLQEIRENQIGSYDPNSVNAAYGEAKRLAETLCAVYRNQKKMPVIIARPFAFIGPYQGLEKPWAINNFIRDGILQGPIRILGNEKTVRSYLYGSDMASWILNLLANGNIGATYNLGSNKGVSLNELANKIASNFKQNIEIFIRSSSNKSPAGYSVPNISAIQSDLKVKQNIDLDIAISKTIKWHLMSKIQN